jgi:hypothetical protein
LSEEREAEGAKNNESGRHSIAVTKGGNTNKSGEDDKIILPRSGHIRVLLSSLAEGVRRIGRISGKGTETSERRKLAPQKSRRGSDFGQTHFK